MQIGSFTVSGAVDEDGHLTLVVESSDGSKVVDVGEDVQVSENEFAVRLTTETTERAYAETSLLTVPSSLSVPAGLEVAAYWVGSNGDSPSQLFFTWDSAVMSECPYLDSFSDTGKVLEAFHFVDKAYTKDF